MRFEFEAIPATFVARPNRFVVVARLDRTGEVVRAHCADPGRMRELLTPDVRVFLSRSANPGRKTAFDLRFVEAPGTGQLVSIDSRLPNELFAEALCTGSLGAFAGFEVERREAAMPGHVVDAAGVRSRLDFVLRNGDGDRIWV